MSDEEQPLGADVGFVFFDYGVTERSGIVVCHRDRHGNFCTCCLFFKNEETQRDFPERPLWEVESFEPLTIKPSVVCKACGLHGYIRGGQWEIIP